MHTIQHYVMQKVIIFCVDSDDWVQDGFINNFIDKVSNSEYNGYIAYKIDAEGNFLSKRFPNYLEECSLFDLSEVYHCHGEFSLILERMLQGNLDFLYLRMKNLC